QGGRQTAPDRARGHGVQQPEVVRQRDVGDIAAHGEHVGRVAEDGAALVARRLQHLLAVGGLVTDPLRQCLCHTGSHCLLSSRAFFPTIQQAPPFREEGLVPPTASPGEIPPRGSFACGQAGRRRLAWRNQGDRREPKGKGTDPYSSATGRYWAGSSKPAIQAT